MMRGPAVPARGWWLTSWRSPLSLAQFRLLWRRVLGETPLPVAIAVDPVDHAPPIVPTADHERAAIHHLIGAGYLALDRGAAEPVWDLVRLLRVLASPDFEVRARIDIRGQLVRSVAASRRRRPVVLVEVRGNLVSLSEVDTPSPAVAAVSALPRLRPGRLTVNVPTHGLERAVAEFTAADPLSEWRRFAAVLGVHLPPADVADLFKIAQFDGWLDASFTAARANGRGALLNASRPVGVRGTHEHGCYAVSRKGDRTIIEPADEQTLHRRITELLDSVGAA